LMPMDRLTRTLLHRTDRTESRSAFEQRPGPVFGNVPRTRAATRRARLRGSPRV
jgi:hypothetical protein